MKTRYKLSIIILSNPSNGNIDSIDGLNISYSADSNFNGVDSIEYKVSDGALTSDNTIANITVIPVNDPPIIDSISDQVIDEDGSLSLTLSAFDVDEDGLTFSALSDNENVSVTVDGLV